MSGKKLRIPWWGIAAGLFLLIIVYAFFVLWVGKDAYIQALLQVPIQALAVGLVLSSVNFLLRFFRWQWFLQAAYVPIPLGFSAWIFLAGLAFTMTPGKVGEVVKSVFCYDFGVPYKTTFAIVWLERLFDLLSVAALFSLGLFFLGVFWWKLACIVWVFLLGVLWVVHTHLGRKWVLRMLPRRWAPMEQWFSELDRIGTRRLLPAAMILSLVGWLCEGVAFWWILRNLSVPVGLGFAQSAYFAATLAGVFFPGGVGGTEGTLVWALSKVATVPASLAAVTAVRAVTLGWATCLGSIAAAGLFWRRRKEVS